MKKSLKSNTVKGFIKVPKCFLKNMKLQEAVFLGYLIELVNYSSKYPKYTKEVDEVMWTQCSSNRVQKNLNLTPRSERTLVENLVEMGILERKMLGNPARRFIRLDEDRIKKLSK